MREKIAVLFAGQGSQKVGMGKELYEAFQEAREVFDYLPAVVKNTAFYGSENELTKTEMTQPILVAYELAIWSILEKEGFEAYAFAGLSLGEISAFSANKMLSTKEAIDLVIARGEAMARAAQGKNFGMTAVFGMEEEELNQWIQEVHPSYGRVYPSNFNCPGQIVISGEESAVRKAEEILKEKGAKRLVPLKVSGAFHTPYMEGAKHDFKNALERIHWGYPKAPIAINTTGNLLQDQQPKDVLEEQLVSPVRFQACVENLLNLGVETFVEIGPDKTLSSFIRKINRKAKVYSIDSLESLQQFLPELKEKCCA